MERRHRQPVLLEDVRENPIRHRADAAFGVLELLQNIRRGKIRVMDRIARRIGRAPFGELRGRFALLYGLRISKCDGHLNQ